MSNKYFNGYSTYITVVLVSRIEKYFQLVDELELTTHRITFLIHYNEFHILYLKI